MKTDQKQAALGDRQPDAHLPSAMMRAAKSSTKGNFVQALPRIFGRRATKRLKRVFLR
jgi:hypothetical protein